MMADYPAMPLWTDAYLADAGHLTTLEHGAYLLLLMTMWRNGGSLENNDIKLARYCRLTKGQWTRVKPTILEFFNIEDGTITQSRLTREYEFVRQRSNSAKDSANARWLKTNNKPNANAYKSHPKRNASTPTPIKKVISDCFKDIRGDIRIESGSDEAAAWLRWLRANDRQCPNPLNGFFYFKSKLPPQDSSEVKA